MILPIHKRAVDLWLTAKQLNEKENPTTFIYIELTGKISEKYPKAKDITELCAGINDILCHQQLSEQDKIEIQKYGIIQFRASQQNLGFVKLFSFLTFAINILTIISLIVGGINWWIIGLAIGTWWAKGVAKMATQKQVTDPGPKWELPIHYIIHMTLVVILIVMCVKNMI